MEDQIRIRVLNTQLRVQKLDPRATLPHKAYDGDLAYDLYPVEMVSLKSKDVTLVSTGLAFHFPDGFGGVIKDRGSTPKKVGMFTVSGVVDNGYTGEVFIAFYNPRGYDIIVPAGKACAQIILTPVVTVEVVEVPDISSVVTQRGANSLGSSDR